ncbi:cyclic pyranopterin monophosphate synthase MoaC [Shouchella sp. 1P09AA]|uniref:cyclic pyranopterin monophosphate synthase MoaC n=1 Tax=unclassified Shouchella TaxID=2893065 RepID=UPI0039A1C95C
MTSFSHFNNEGRAKMVNVADKDETARTATARTKVRLSPALYQAIHEEGLKKGDPLSVAQVAGIMAAKKTADWIPMCHPITIQGTDLTFSFSERKESNDYVLVIHATVTVKSNTGVEMEALTAVSAAALTFYDMCKAVDKSMIIEETLLVEKTGGKNGDFYHPLLEKERSE